MKAIAIRQPWASLILCGAKDVENRNWRLPAAMVGQRVVVHASKKRETRSYVTDVMGWHEDYVIGLDDRLPIDWNQLPAGALLGEVTITGCVQQSESRWFLGPYGFLLADPVTYAKPIPYKGQLGFFDVPDSVIRP